MTDLGVTRAEFEALQRRVEQMDQQGTHGVSTLSGQISGLVRDFGDLKADTRAWQAKHELEHEHAEQERRSTRRWLTGAFIAAVAAVDGPVVTIVLARGR